MNNWVIYSIGFLAQILFSLRLIFQWLSSEKEKHVVTPVLFWILSLVASFFLFIYGFLRDDFAIMFGQILTYFIYIRNLQLQNQWNRISKFFRFIIVVFPFLLGAYFFFDNTINIEKIFRNETITMWLLILGMVSQIVFTFRFIYQWIYSEKKNESTLPIGFWIMSLIGSLLILVYAIFRKDPVLLIAHIFGVIIYSRNIILLTKQA